MSFLLPSLQEAHFHHPVDSAAESISAAAPASIAPSPHQARAAAEAYQAGAHALMAKNYSTAAAFKKALEKYPAFTEAYTGLADASMALGEEQAAVTNAQHALDQLSSDNTSHVPGLTPEAGAAWPTACWVRRCCAGPMASCVCNSRCSGKWMQTALFHCKQALSFDASDAPARHCRDAATRLAASL